MQWLTYCGCPPNACIVFAWRLQETHNEEEAKNHLVTRKLPRVLQVLDVESNGEQTTLTRLLMIVSTIYEYPPLQESMFGDMIRRPDMEGFVCTLARHCGLHPHLGPNSSGATRAIIHARCSYLQFRQIHYLVQSTTPTGSDIANTNDRTRLIDALCTVDRAFDFEDIHHLAPGKWCDFAVFCHESNAQMVICVLWCNVLLPVCVNLCEPVCGFCSRVLSSGLQLAR